MNSTSSTRNNNSAKAKARAKDTDMMFFDPTLIKAARNIYRNYCSLNMRADIQPMGVVINRDNHRGQLAFRAKPILLPREYFISIKQIEAEIY
ncbi:hypothetical protein [Pleurocapsa sp. PCC 7319]|uniref:hypothetical protein n=1 Tax=Pleurocapsa sp. PCC 7319 TaxID=118161 RepID=UPI000347349D|nr:hypothetical protein [Pleurocapsa sp. PCC 7319]